MEVPSQLKDSDHRRFDNTVKDRRTKSPYCDRALFVNAAFEQGFARFTIADQGNGFDPAAVRDPTRPENLGRVHGRGLYLIRAFMDEVVFNEQGNEIQLSKRVSEN